MCKSKCTEASVAAAGVPGRAGGKGQTRQLACGTRDQRPHPPPRVASTWDRYATGGTGRRHRRSVEPFGRLPLNRCLGLRSGMCLSPSPLRAILPMRYCALSAGRWGSGGARGQRQGDGGQGWGQVGPRRGGVGREEGRVPREPSRQAPPLGRTTVNTPPHPPRTIAASPAAG